MEDMTMEAEQKKILLFGGTFNPIHNGHLIVSTVMAEQIGAEKVCLIPNGIPPHKDSMLSLPHKMRMLELAVGGDNSFEVSKYEIEKRTPSYTLETVRFIRMCQGDDVKIYWMIGPDNILEIKKWYKIEELAKECTFLVGISSSITEDLQKVTKLRSFQGQGIDIQTVIIPHLDIRGTDIRERVQKGLSIRHYVPNAVEKYIKKHGLYSTNEQS